MKVARLLFVVAIIFGSAAWLHAQTAPNLENGFKSYGSYDGSHLDTVNLMTGGLIFHAPLIADYPQRGKITPHYNLYMSSKNWQVKCIPSSTGNACYWSSGGTGVTLQTSVGMLVQRTLDIISGDQNNVVTYTAFGYSLTSPDGSAHQLYPVPGHLDANGESTVFESLDTSGYHLSLNSDGTFSVLDRQGDLYTGLFGGAHCGKPAWNTLPGPASRGAPVFDTSPYGDKYCPQGGFATLVSDSNGNQMSLHGPLNANPSVDTLGMNFPVQAAVGSPDYGKCVSALPIAVAYLSSYIAPDGTTQTIETCYAYIGISTAFSQAGVAQVPNSIDPNSAQQLQLVTAIMADQTKWTYTYDSYGEVASVALPAGGSITYGWTEINFSNCPSGTVPGTVSGRAVASRTLNDGQGHSYTWHYFWGNASSTTLTNYVTDPAGNDTVHTFTALDNLSGGPHGCSFYETTTKYFQGSQTSGQLLKRVDTQYSSAMLPVDAGPAGSSLGNVVPTSITTTVYPSGKVSMITKQYDAGLGANAPIFGNVTIEKQYDWGVGAPGPLLRETDTTYQWQVNSAYLAAHMLDLPAKVIIKDASGNRVAETDYTYDEPAYLTTPNPAITTQHGAPPYSVRGNQTTVSRWLNTTNSFIASHTNWYDTGEVYKAIDPLGHETTHSYDPFYVGAYSTQTCSPTTNGVTHCVSGTYDFNTGVLTSLTNENATTQASGNTPGDSAHTSNYTYDFMFRIASAQAPPDPANSNLRAATNFTFSAPNTFPITVQRSKSVTTALSDSATSFFDGLGRGNKSQHALPNGTATVDTTFDLAGHAATVSNPYFSTSDPTYGNTTNAYDALDRVTQTTKQDGSISRVAYSAVTGVAAAGDCTQTTDEAGKQRGACSDALGRLVEVDEPSGVAPQANYHALMQTDGNFVVLNSAGASMWATGTAATNAASIFMQDDGNLVTYIFKWQAGVYATPTPGSYPNSACSIGTYLVAGQMLPSGKCIVSPHGQYFLLMNTDGNFFIYDWAHGTGTWGPGTQGHPGAYAIFQTDGNLVVYDVNGTALWNSGTSGTYAERLDMNDDGRIIIWKSAWNSGTSNGQFNGTTYAHPGCDVGLGTGTIGVLGAGSCFVSPNGRFELLMQTDGNMAIYDRSVTPNAAIWSTGTGLSTADPSVAYRTLYFYDTLGNLTCVEQHGDATSGTGCNATPSSDASSPWRVRRFTYDSFSRLLTANNPESGTISYTYDNDGNLLQKTSPLANQTGTATQTVSYCYDELHRVTGKGYGAQSCPLSTPVVTYAYDSGTNAKGHLTSLSDQAGTANYTYDILGRITTETRTLAGANNAAISKNLSYEYNLDGSLAKLHYPSGAVVTYTPDSAGRTLSAVDGGSGINYVTGATYGPDSALTGFVSGNSTTFAGVTNAFSYNRRLQPLTMSATAPSQTVYSIGYDFHAGNGTANSGTDNGNVWGIYNYRDRNRDQSFTYDALNRLISAQNAGTDCAAKVLQNKTEYWGNNYGYDAWGNLLQKTVTKCGAENLSVTADAHNWLHASGTDYQYDAAGNMTFDATASLSYTFDPENRLTGAAGYTYTYDGDGNRVRKSNGNLAANGTLYWYMTPGVVAESDLAGTLKSEYVFFDGERVARRDGPTGAGGVFYYFSDHLKTASVITDSVGVIKAESDYYPWGGELQFVNNDSNDYKFTGKKRDTETGLDYFGARYYSNGLGRWVSADWSATPIPVPYADFGDPQSLNLYQFVGGNPASKADPDGHCVPCLMHAAEEFAESPVGEELLRDGGKIAGAIGTGVAIGWASTSNFVKEVWHDGTEAMGNSGASLSDLPQPQPPQGLFGPLQSSKDAPADPKKPGTLGKPDHQETAKEEAQKIGGKTEVKINTPGASKDSRRADAAQVDKNGNYKPGGKIVQVIRPTKAGNVPQREKDAAQDIQNATGVKPQLVPVRPLPKKEDK